MKLIWSQSAVRSLEELHQYIAKDSPYYAARFVTELLSKIDLLADFPNLGKTVEETDQQNIRQLIHQGYRIIYKIHSEKIELLTIVHGSKNTNI